MPSEFAKEQFLRTYEREHETTVRVLRAYPADQLDLRPHPGSRSARDLAWLFVLECGLGTRVFNDQFAKMAEAGPFPPAPQDLDEILAAFEKAHEDYRDLIRATPAE